MATIAKTIVATGVSSGLGFEAIKQLLAQAVPYNFILGARDIGRTQAAFDALKFDNSRHSLTVLPLELSDLKGTRVFAQTTLEKLGQDRIDYLLLNAGITNGAENRGPNGSKWCEAYIVNHLSQHYLTHLFRQKLVDSGSHVVVVSSGAVRRVEDPRRLWADVTAIYCETKFVQLLGALWWRRQLTGQCVVVAVSPGLIPNTGIGRGSGMKMTMAMPDARTVPEGAASILAALTRNDVLTDPEHIFLTSWGEWWGKDVYAKNLDRALQDKWSPSKEQIEQEEGLMA